MNAMNLLVAQFPGRAFIPMTQAGAAIGYKPQTCYNLFHGGLFPLPVRKIGAKSMVALMDLANYMNGESTQLKEVTIESSLPKKAGRPTKAEMIARRNAT